MLENEKSSEIRQKDESQNGGDKKQSTTNFPKNERFLPSDTHTYLCVSGGKKYLFFVKFGELCFLVTSVLRFALLPYNRRGILAYYFETGWLLVNLYTYLDHF